ncbi:ABC transporter permease [Neoactinobaculum massilliense]|uniref:ABC transporter permease n=1 Tax=Neoactinobaculum massilliense TaxID=2364794 RepID=UPI000F520362|nr:iron ABC transporter permease [Neoactinobaculum massilliense]
MSDSARETRRARQVQTVQAQPHSVQAPPRPVWVPAVRVLAGVAAALFLAVFFVWPILAMLVRGVMGEGGGLDASRFLTNLSAARTWRVAWQTVWLAFAGTAASVLFGVPLAFVLYRLEFPGRRVARAAAMIPFVLPTVVVGGAFRALFDPAGPYGALGLSQSNAAVVCAMAFFNAAVVARTTGTVWEKLPPHEEAAATLGASPARAFLTVTLPELVPAIAAGASLAFLFCATSYGLVVTLGTPGYGTLETEVFIQTTTFLDLPAAAVLSLLQAVIVLVAIWVSGIATRRTEVGLKLGSRRARRPGRAAIPAVAMTLIFVVGLVAAPIISLIVASFHRGGAWTVANYVDLVTPGTFNAGVTPAEAMVNSLRIGAEAALLALAVGLLVVVAAVRPARSGFGRWCQRLLDAGALAPLGISAVTLGFGIFITLRLRVSEPSMLIPVAQALVATPLVVRAVSPTLLAIDLRLREAAATLGASPWRVMATVDLPAMWRGLGVAAGFAFAISLGEFGATSFLATADSETLPVLVAKLLGRPGSQNYGMAMAAAVVLAVLAGLVVLLSDMAGDVQRAGDVLERAPHGMERNQRA